MSFCEKKAEFGRTIKVDNHVNRMHKQGKKKKFWFQYHCWFCKFSHQIGMSARDLTCGESEIFSDAIASCCARVSFHLEVFFCSVLRYVREDDEERKAQSSVVIYLLRYCWEMKKGIFCCWFAARFLLAVVLCSYTQYHFFSFFYAITIVIMRVK